MPGRLPGSRALGARVLHRAAGVVAASEYSAREAVRAARRRLPGVVVPPGVDVDRFRPIDAGERLAVRKAFGLDDERPLVRRDEPPGAAQGIRRAHRRRRGVARRAARDRGRRARPPSLGGARDEARAGRPSPLPRPRARRRAGAAARVRRPVRDAVPRPVARPRSGGVRHRVPRSCRRGRAGGGGPQRGLPRSGRRRRHRLRRRRPERARGARRDRPARRRRRAAGADGQRGARPARCRSSPYDHLVERLAPLAAGDLSGLGLLT